MSLTKQLKLYAITNRKRIDTSNSNLTTAEAVEQAILGGATIIQLREKELNTEDFLKVAIDVKKVIDKYDNVPLIINDNVEVAIKCNANGIHLGQDDLKKYNNNLIEIRKQFGNNKIIGISTHNVKEAIDAEKIGANYLGVGCIFPTKTKLDTVPTSIETLTQITHSVKIPCVAIGGMHDKTIPLLKNTGIVGVAMISAIFAFPDIKKETNKLLNIINNTLFE